MTSTFCPLPIRLELQRQAVPARQSSHHITKEILLKIVILCHRPSGATKQSLTPACWIECHSTTINAVPLPSRELNDFYALALNCQNPPYISTLATCLAAKCESAPDTAYAAEYAESVCKRAGVEVKVELPEYYLEAAQEYFT